MESSHCRTASDVILLISCLLVTINIVCVCVCVCVWKVGWGRYKTEERNTLQHQLRKQQSCQLATHLLASSAEQLHLIIVPRLQVNPQ